MQNIYIYNIIVLGLCILINISKEVYKNVPVIVRFLKILLSSNQEEHNSLRN